MSTKELFAGTSGEKKDLGYIRGGNRGIDLHPGREKRSSVTSGKGNEDFGYIRGGKRGVRSHPGREKEEFNNIRGGKGRFQLHPGREKGNSFALKEGKGKSVFILSFWEIVSNLR